MKILAIRGKNLASLAGEFCIELESGPLAQSGLFAITGPTGAGKTTLLDALCLALYDKTPRLDTRSSVRIGRPGEDDELRVNATDVRSVLRRGTASGFAEVDFVGRDGHRYRSRWQVRRARRRVDGRLQKQEMSLEDLDSGHQLGGTKTETLEAIEDRLGLSFEQFRRSALLAQGDFAAFLRASSKERAELLERMTGTQIYSEISQAAFLRAKHERQALEAMTAQVEQHAVLDDDARAALEAELAAAVEAVAAVETRLAEARAVLAWYAELDKLRQAEATAQKTLDQRRAQWNESAAWRAELDAVVQARQLRAEISAVDTATAELERARADIATLSTRRTELEAQVAAAAAARTVATTALDEARAALKAAQPQLTEAHRVDGQLGAARRAVDAAQKLATEARRRVDEATAAVTRLQGELDQNEAQAAEAKAWLSDNAEVELVASEWNRWRALLDRYAKALAERGAAESQRLEAVDADERCRGKLAAASKAQAGAKQRWAESTKQAERAERDADEQPVDAVRTRAKQVAARREHWAALVQAAADAVGNTEAAAQARRDAEAARSEAAEAAKQLVELERWFLRVDAQCGEAERALNQVKLAQEMTDLRSELVDGQPCPLCGADDHPFAETDKVNELASAQEQRLDDLQKERRDVDDQRVAETRRQQAATTAASHADDQAASCDQAVADAAAAWKRALEQLGELALHANPADARAGQWAAEQLAACAASLEQLQTAEEHAVALREAAIAARSTATTRRSEYDEAVDAFREAERAAQATTRLLADIDGMLKRVAKDMASVTAELAPAFAHAAEWRAELAADADGFCARWQAAVEAWRGYSDTRDRCERLGRELRAKLDETTKQRDVYATDHGAAAARLGEAQADLEALTERRGQLFGGRAVDEVAAALEAALTAAESKLTEHAHTHQQASETLTSVTDQLASQQRNAAQRTEALDGARAALNTALAKAELDEAGVRKHLAVADDWVREHTERRDALAAAVEKQATVVEERRAQRAQHEQGQPPAITAEQADQAEQAARAELTTAGEKRVELATRLRGDDEARKAHAALSQQLVEQQQREQLYQSLCDLIGSADGSKFREFAQSLTLEALLSAANHHLRELHMRYQLLRVPDHHLELQVMDRTMGDEVRSVNSLSGGESFLVSLALALGLSSLSAKDTRVESLLIDEGFGTLDQDTLDVALAVLDSLQASGRKVGLISHVPGMAERIGVRVAVTPQGGGRSTVSVVQ